MFEELDEARYNDRLLLPVSTLSQERCHSFLYSMQRVVMGVMFLKRLFVSPVLFCVVFLGGQRNS